MKLLRTIIATVLLISMVLPLAACSSALTEEIATAETVTEEAVDTTPVVEAPKIKRYPIKDLEGYLRLVGERTTFTSTNLLALEWAGNGFEISIDAPEGGTEVILHSRCNYGANWVVFVDDVLNEKRFSIGTGNKETVIANLTEGVHKVRVLKDTQQGTSKENYNNVVALSFFGEPVAPDQGDKELFLEFIGDGYFTGYGALGNKPESSNIANDSSFVASLPYLVSSALNADYSVVAHTSIGLQTKLSGYTLNTLYPQNNGWRDAAVLYTPDRIPDAIVIHANYNDSSKLTQAQFIDETKAYINYLRSYYGEAGKDIPVVWLYGAMYITTRANALKIMDMQMDENVHLVQLPYGRNGAGTKEIIQHPSAQEHQSAADVLIPFLKDVLSK